MKQATTIPQRAHVEISAEAALFEMNRYESFLKDMNSNTWKKKAQVMICDMDTAYIQTFNIKSGMAGKIIELRCPGSQAISVFGNDQTLSLRCFDKSSRELDPATRINFKKVTKYGGICRNCRVTYGNISPAKAIKYSFLEGLYLRGEEVLFIEVLNPDIDVEQIEISIDADIFEMFDQAC